MDTKVEKYMQTVPPGRKERVGTLHSMILKIYPTATVDMKYKMPTYHIGDGWVALANQKNYVSLYTCGYHHIEKFKALHPTIKTGKGCINFKDRDEIPMSDVEQVVRHAIEHPKPDNPIRGHNKTG